jgi:hypothetical protein
LIYDLKTISTMNKHFLTRSSRHKEALTNSDFVIRQSDF